jgi:hypothetical protein
MQRDGAEDRLSDALKAVAFSDLESLALLRSAIA